MIEVGNRKLDIGGERFGKAIVRVVQPSQNRSLETTFAQVQGLVDIGNTEVIDLGAIELEGNLKHSVAIGVGLNHGHNLRPGCALSVDV